jgi:hypothetical protein
MLHPPIFRLQGWTTPHLRGWPPHRTRSWCYRYREFTNMVHGITIHLRFFRMTMNNMIFCLMRELTMIQLYTATAYAYSAHTASTSAADAHPHRRPYHHSTAPAPVPMTPPLHHILPRTQMIFPPPTVIPSSRTSTCRACAPLKHLPQTPLIVLTVMESSDAHDLRPKSFKRPRTHTTSAQLMTYEIEPDDNHNDQPTVRSYTPPLRSP